MPRLMVTVQVNRNPLRRAYVEHIVAGVGTAMYMTDDLGRVRDEAGNLGIDSFTRNADIRILCQNSVVKVLDGNTSLLPLAVNQDKTVVDRSVVNLNTDTEQADHYRILNSCLNAYDVVFRQFRPFSDAPLPDFPLGRSSSLRITKDQRRRIEVSFPSQFPLGTLSFAEPKSIATSYPLIHFRRDDRLFGTGSSRPTLIPAEMAHALHFSLFSDSNREKIQNDYIGWIASDFANGGEGKHNMGVRTSPKVAYIEALDHFSGRFSEFVRQVVSGGGQQEITAQIRRDFLNREVSNSPVIGVRDTGDPVATIGSGGNLIPHDLLKGTDDEGSVYGCIFVDFARRVGLRTAVNAYLRSATTGAISFGQYKTWIANNRPEHLSELNAAQTIWGL